MMANFVECEQCGLRAIVKVATDGSNAARRSPGAIATQIIDCPSCGIREQAVRPPLSEIASRDSTAAIIEDLGDAVVGRDALSRRR